jgi:hypothetical protein
MRQRTLNWLIWNAVLAAAIYVGIWRETPYVGYLVSAFVWLMLGIYLLVLYTEEPTKVRESPISWPVGLVFDVAATSVFVARSWFGTATGYVLGALALALIYHRSNPRPDNGA